MDRRLPLLPLETVLFPGALLPLHVFEPRYRVLVERCIAEGSPFGVALIRSGVEVGGPAEPHPVGTTARIVDAAPLPDGRYEIVVRGEHRFAIEELDAETEPYLVGRVRYLDDGDESEHTAALQAAVVDALADHQALVAALGGRLGVLPSTLERPRDTAYGIAARLDLENVELQRLLELPTTVERLAAELRLLEGEGAALQDELVRRRARGDVERPS